MPQEQARKNSSPSIKLLYLICILCCLGWLSRHYWVPYLVSSKPGQLEIKDPSQSSYSAPRQWTREELVNAYDGLDTKAALDWCNRNGISAYDFGVHLHNSGKSELAMKWFTVIGKETNDPKYLYGLAAVRMDIGQYREARRDARVVLDNQPTKLTEARTHYLLGVISRRELDSEAARDWLNQSIADYSSLNKPGGQARCKLELAKVALNQSDYEAVDALLNEFTALDQESVSLGYRSQGIGTPLEIEGEMALKRRDFDGALNLYRQSETAFIDANRLADAARVKPKVGLALFLTGQPAAALELCREVWDEHHADITKSEVLAWSSLVMMKLYLCGQRFDDARKEEYFVKNWADFNIGGKQMLNLLETLKDSSKSPCPEWR